MSNASLYEQLRDRCRRVRVRHYLEIGVREGDVWREWRDANEELLGATQVITEGHGLAIAIRA